MRTFSDCGEPTKTEDYTSSETMMCEKSEVFVGGIVRTALAVEQFRARIIKCGVAMYAACEFFMIYKGLLQMHEIRSMTPC